MLEPVMELRLIAMDSPSVTIRVALDLEFCPDGLDRPCPSVDLRISRERLEDFADSLEREMVKFPVR